MPSNMNDSTGWWNQPWPGCTQPHWNPLPPPYVVSDRVFTSGATLNGDGTVTMHGMTYRYDGTQWVVV
jgi:hypothetical protein